MKYHAAAKGLIKGASGSAIPGQTHDLAPAGRGDCTSPSFAFSSLPRFIRDESSGAPLLSNVSMRSAE